MSNTEQQEVVVKLPEGWLTEKEAQELAKLAQGKRVLEMGAFKGRSTVAMALTAKLVVSVDWHRGDRHVTIGPSLEEYTKNIRPYRNVVPIVGRFDTVLPMLEACQFDMIFVDGQHDFPSVLRDMLLALEFEPKLIAVHDWGLFQVTPAIVALGMVPTYVTDTLAVFDAANTKNLKIVEIEEE